MKSVKIKGVVTLKKAQANGICQNTAKRVVVC